MHIPHRFSLFLLMSMMSASIGACGDYHPRSPLAPLGSLTAAESAFQLAVEPTQLFRSPALGTGCSSRPASRLPFNLRLRSTSSSELFLNQVRFQFIDSAGIVAHTMTMQQPDLLGNFGSVGIPPLGSREFPFSVPVACTTLPLSGFAVFVETMDRTRTPSSRTTRLEIR